MRGYFAIGSERISKPMNLGALMRTANAFGASFVFSINAEHRLRARPTRQKQPDKCLTISGTMLTKCSCPAGVRWSASS